MTLLTVTDVQQVRVERARVNHETYKQLLNAVYERIKRRATASATHLTYAIPFFVPGRPVYDPTHAARYITDKLRRGGFQVETKDQTLHVDWTPRPAVLPSAAPPPPQHKRQAKHDPGIDRRVISARLEALKSKLRG